MCDLCEHQGRMEVVSRVFCNFVMADGCVESPAPSRLPGRARGSVTPEPRRDLIEQAGVLLLDMSFDGGEADVVVEQGFGRAEPVAPGEDAFMEMPSSIDTSWARRCTLESFLP